MALRILAAVGVAAVAQAALVDRTTLRQISVEGGGAASPSLFHMVRPTLALSRT